MADVIAENVCLIVHSNEPFNAEPQLDILRHSFITPHSAFYIRSHGDIPKIDKETYRVQVSGSVEKPLSLSLFELQNNFPTVTVMATMQCAGNRRSDMQPVHPTSGDPWAAGAIGNASWTGVRLSDVLMAASIKGVGETHVAFESLDKCEADGERFFYGASIPLSKAMSPEVLLAWDMNGEPLTPEHGFPLRLVVPGYAGVRSPKWIAEITVQSIPSTNHIQARDYKLLPPDITKETVKWESGITINEMPLNSAICEPAPRAQIKAGRSTVRGWATASGRIVTRVDLSADGGHTWHQAELEQECASQWCWTFWSAAMELGAGELELVVRAWDSAGQTQPALASEVWNFKGYLSAAWHRITVNVI